MASYFESIDSILKVVREEANPSQCLSKIIAIGRECTPSKIWDTYVDLDLDRDIQEAKVWMIDIVSQFPDFNGLCFGLDTLNMSEGEGYNIQLGFGKTCNPELLDQDWCFECYHYGEEYLIKSLSDVEESFSGEDWSYDERSAAEYIIFLGFSGIVLREALLALETANDFGAVWGFHDGDMFTLMNKIGSVRTVLAK